MERKPALEKKGEGLVDRIRKRITAEREARAGLADEYQLQAEAAQVGSLGKARRRRDALMRRIRRRHKRRVIRKALEALGLREPTKPNRKVKLERKRLRRAANRRARVARRANRKRSA